MLIPGSRRVTNWEVPAARSKVYTAKVAASLNG